MSTAEQLSFDDVAVPGTYRRAADAIAAGPYRPRNGGTECETWTGLISDPLRPRAKRRQRVTIWRHPQAWPVEDCSRRPQSCSGVLDGPVCSRLRGTAAERPPVVWRVGDSGTNHSYCDGDLPAAYRALVSGPSVMRRYVHPHDKPSVTWVGDGWRACPPCICGDPGKWPR
jgi:hypothetical protein